MIVIWNKNHFNFWHFGKNITISFMIVNKKVTTRIINMKIEFPAVFTRSKFSPIVPAIVTNTTVYGNNVTNWFLYFFMMNLSTTNQLISKEVKIMSEIVLLHITVTTPRYVSTMERLTNVNKMITLAYRINEAWTRCWIIKISVVMFMFLKEHTTQVLR
jgi:hypothetical protein